MDCITNSTESVSCVFVVLPKKQKSLFHLSQSFYVPQDSSHRSTIPEDMLQQEQTETGPSIISFHVQP